MGGGGAGDFKITRSEPFRGREEEEEAEPLPFMHFGDEDEEEEEAEAPAAMEFDAEPPGLAEAEPTGAEEAREEALEEASAELREEAVAGGHEALAAEGQVDEAIEALQAEIDARPDDLELRQRLVEYAFRTGEDDTLVSAYLGLAETLRRQGSDQRAEAIYKQVLDTDPENQDAQRALIGLSGKKEEEAPAAEVASSEE
ncbi:MAG: tetratricopeptide repeat protein, partial [Gemmatimonadetes bacterium]|nr:tetratricopeptide repeat protein [Gemmatimonadota bacterium]NIR80173.1 tetratricopeptide repeat protein [Gemmatimonadota bacterium]NIT88936.1 tetratricopeptide repeat protein [Gemmatimonadota bacterium]NIU32729.1 tetratricopeptide repeat protein [Gemmatimonadota bacterium]NIU37164.1 tetratricopeptide repeat protein [Gemmatimonadota bacterium]